MINVNRKQFSKFRRYLRFNSNNDNWAYKGVGLFAKAFSQYKMHDQFRARLMLKVSCKENSGFLIKSVPLPYLYYDNLFQCNFQLKFSSSVLFLQVYQ